MSGDVFEFYFDFAIIESGQITEHPPVNIGLAAFHLVKVMRRNISNSIFVLHTINRIAKTDDDMRLKQNPPL